MPVSFALAGPGDEGEIRRLLRENPLGGSWQISLEREPDGLGGPHLPGERQVFVLARDCASGNAIGLCERLVRPGFVGGKRQMLPYLGALRIAQSHRNRLAILRGGFAILREQAERPDECPFALTSIAADNRVAKRLLEAGLKGMPRYLPVGGYVTQMYRVRRFAADPGITPIQVGDLSELAEFLNSEAARRACAPVWEPETLEAQPGLTFLALRLKGKIVGAVGLWDQRSMRQVVLRGLPPLLARLRQPLNLLAPVLRLPAVPAPGEAIDQAFLSGLSVRGDDPALALRLVRAGLTLAAGREIKVATLGLPVGHGWQEPLRRQLRPIEYRTDLYLVYWPDAKIDVEPDYCRVFPDVALL